MMMKKNKKIVVFGTDNSGKTTLVSNICDTLISFTKSHSLGPVSVEEMLKYTLDNLNSDTNFVFDRFPMIEEMTCGYVLRGYNKFGGMTKTVVDCFNKVSLFIYCDPGIDEITNWGDRDQMDGVKDNIFQLKAAYDRVWTYINDLGYPCIKYNWKNGKQEFNKIIERIKKA